MGKDPIEIPAEIVEKLISSNEKTIDKTTKFDKKLKGIFKEKKKI